MGSKAGTLQGAGLRETPRRSLGCQKCENCPPSPPQGWKPGLTSSAALPTRALVQAPREGLWRERKKQK